MKSRSTSVPNIKYSLTFGFVLTLVFLITGFILKYERDVQIVDNIEQKVSLEKQFSEKRILVVFENEAEIPEDAVILNKFVEKEVIIAVIPVDQDNSDEDPLGVASSEEEVKTVEKALYKYIENEGVIDVSPDYLSKLAAWSDNGTQAFSADFDTTITDKHWYYEKSKLPEFWHNQGCPGSGNCGGNSSVVVAVIDSGLAYESYDDSGTYGFTGNNFTGVSSEYSGSFNLFVNSGEVENDGLDNDCNGVIDDYHGIDMFAFSELEYSDQVNGQPLSERTCNSDTPVDFSASTDLFRRKPGHPVDSNGHGSMVTGLIAGVVDNAGDTVSPAFNVSILPISVSVNAIGSSYTSQTYTEPQYTYIWTTDVANAIDYAGLQGVDIINMSLSGLPYDAIFETWFINYWYSQGITFIAASGNDSTSVSMQPVSYPAAYTNVISVGAVNPNDSRSKYSNGGSNLDLVAYVGDGSTAGNAVYQESLDCFDTCTSASSFTTISPKYSVGTTFAAPQVSAAAALILSMDNTFSPSDVKDILLLATVDIGPAGYDNESGNGALDFSQLPSFDLDTALVKNFTVYRWLNGDRAWIWVGNPSTTTDANFVIRTNGTARVYNRVAPETNIPVKFDGVFEGPVEILSDIEVNVTQKIVTSYGKLNEQVAISDTQYDTTFYYPIYRWVNGDKAWIWIANPSDTTTANVNVKIGSTDLGNIQIAPETLEFVKSEGAFSGPVLVTSDIPIYTTLKTLVGGGINEYKGISSSETDTTFYYPIYRWLYGDKAWIWIGNPDSISDANIDVSLNGTVVGSYVVPAGENIYVKYEDTFEGPVKITSDRPVFTTLKALVGGVINEFPGIRDSDLSTSFYYPVYRWIYDDRAWIWIGNPDGVNSAVINVSIAGSNVGTYVVPPNDNIYVKYEGVFDGPVEISSDRPVYSTMKSYVKGSIDEFVGIQ